MDKYKKEIQLLEFLSKKLNQIIEHDNMKPDLKNTKFRKIFIGAFLNDDERMHKDIFINLKE